MRYNPTGKRLLDLAVAVPALIASLPIQAAVAVAVRRKLGSPVLFRQTRPGLHGEPFELLKFRTMLPVDPAKGQTDDASRLTPFGAWLRSTSLDELPSLWNIVRGDLSLVGPRPLRMHYLPHYTADQNRRHNLKPGLTGLAQVNGRNATTWEERFHWDLRYVETVSLLLDVSILAKTAAKTILREGITSEGSSTMTPFAPSGIPAS